MSQEQNYFSTSDVAKRYRVTERAVRKWIADGLLPGSEKKSPRPHSDWMIPESAIERFDEQRKAASQT